MATHTPTIIPVASGKGGVGKSMITANVALAVARMGHRTIAMDLDLGGSNLHLFLGVPNRYPGVGDFLKAKRGELEDLLVPTLEPRLRFIPGDGKTPFMANIAHAQKVKLINRIQKLDADYIFLDLGAGSTFHTLDLFGLKPRGLLVTTPDYPAILSMLSFLKNYILRAIERRMVPHRSVHLMLREIFTRPLEEQMPSIETLQSAIDAEDPAAGRIAAAIYRNCRPRIIFNQGRHPDDSKMAANISKSMATVLNVEADYFGFVFADAEVHAAARANTPLLEFCPDGMAARNIAKIAERVVKYWSQNIPDSAALIHKSAAAIYAAAK